MRCLRCGGRKAEPGSRGSLVMEGRQKGPDGSFLLALRLCCKISYQEHENEGQEYSTATPSGGGHVEHSAMQRVSDPHGFVLFEFLVGYKHVGVDDCHDGSLGIRGGWQIMEAC